MKRIIIHLKEDWYKYGLEILVIIIGVLIAIAFDDWESDRQNRKIEEITLQNLKTDLQLSQKQLKRKIKLAQLNAQSDSIILMHIRHRKPQIDADSLLSLIAPRRFPPTYDPDDGTIQDILSTGKIGLIHNIELRTHISSWGKYIAEVKEVENGITEHHLSFKERYTASRIPYRNPRIFRKSRIAWDDEKLLRDLKFENLNSQSYSMYKILEKRYKTHYKTIEKMLHLIAEDNL